MSPAGPMALFASNCRKGSARDPKMQLDPYATTA